MGRKLLLVFGMLTLFNLTEQRSEPLYVGDCTDIKTNNPDAPSGMYTILPKGASVPFKVFCEMLKNGGWTVFQRRSGPKLDFDRNWNEYKHGFGSLIEDHWLGLDKVWTLTKSEGRTFILRVDLWDFEGGSAFAEYKNFKIGSEQDNYKLSVGRYKGTAGDAIRGQYSGIDQNGFGFSTKDRDNDGCSPCLDDDIAYNRCTGGWENGGGWWFGNKCGSAKLHGKWHQAPKNIFWSSGVYWLTWKGLSPYSLRATRMMVKST